MRLDTESYKNYTLRGAGVASLCFLLDLTEARTESKAGKKSAEDNRRPRLSLEALPLHRSPFPQDLRETDWSGLHQLIKFYKGRRFDDTIGLLNTMITTATATLMSFGLQPWLCQLASLNLANRSLLAVFDGEPTEFEYYPQNHSVEGEGFKVDSELQEQSADFDLEYTVAVDLVAVSPGKFLHQVLSKGDPPRKTYVYKLDVPCLQTIDTRIKLARALARQWFGICITSAGPEDEWLLDGLSGFLTDSFIKKHFGNNEACYRRFKANCAVCKLENSGAMQLFWIPHLVRICTGHNLSAYMVAILQMLENQM
ncbi:hypothetical protein MLD38_036592 [Melastoma candidum]|uniref:Uncharacterized protein n=1 Tax=Melastoma candidum TaxID=119954 RepID=A0ACB9LJH8_9MYRT|nr:hypothetical protein MLD38_036592 [Melastoma candidum]